MPRVLPIVGVLAVIAVLYLLVVFFAQRLLLFPAPAAPAEARPPAGTDIVRLATSDGAVEAWYLPPTSTTSATPAPLLIFTHGNGELIDHWGTSFAEPRAWGVGVLLVEYPGYGRSAGAPSEASITQAVLAAYDWARHDARVDSARIIPYGRSLGGGPATRLAVERPVPALILESTYTSVRAMAGRVLVPGFLVRDPFDNVGRLRHYRGPLLVVHGDRDEVIPFAFGQAVAAAVPGAEFHALHCGHNDCPRPWAIVRAFLVTHRLLAAPGGGRAAGAARVNPMVTLGPE